MTWKGLTKKQRMLRMGVTAFILLCVVYIIVLQVRIARVSYELHLWLANKTAELERSIREIAKTGGEEAFWFQHRAGECNVLVRNLLRLNWTFANRKSRSYFAYRSEPFHPYLADFLVVNYDEVRYQPELLTDIADLLRQMLKDLMHVEGFSRFFSINDTIELLTEYKEKLDEILPEQ